jgi:hypothetical protein
MTGYRQVEGIVVGIGLALPSAGIEHLAKIALLIEQPDARDRDAEIARGLEIVAGEDAEAAGIERKRFAQPELHAEVRHAAESPALVRRLVPGPRVEITRALFRDPRQLVDERGIGRKCIEALLCQMLHHDPRAARAFPEIGAEHAPQAVPGVAPCPPRIEGELREDLEAGRETARKK